MVLRADLKVSRVGARQMSGGRAFQRAGLPHSVSEAPSPGTGMESRPASEEGLGWGVMVEEVRQIPGDEGTKGFVCEKKVCT